MGGSRWGSRVVGSTDGQVEVEPTDGGVGLVVCVVHFFLTDEYKMAKHAKRSVTRRRKSQKKSMRKGTRKQRGGTCVTYGCPSGTTCDTSTGFCYGNSEPNPGH